MDPKELDRILEEMKKRVVAGVPREALASVGAVVTRIRAALDRMTEAQQRRALAEYQRLAEENPTALLAPNSVTDAQGRTSHVEQAEIRARAQQAVPPGMGAHGHTTGGELQALGLAPRTQFTPERTVQPASDDPRAVFEHIAANPPTGKEMVAESLEKEREAVREISAMVHYILTEEGMPRAWDEVGPTFEMMLRGGRDMMTPGDKARPLVGEIAVSLTVIPGAVQAFRDVFSDFMRGEVDGWTALAGLGLLPVVGPYLRGRGRLGRYSRALDNTAGWADALADARRAGLPITKTDLYHWSRAPRKVIEASQQGSKGGIGGRELERLARLEPEFAEKFARPQAHFYTTPAAKEPRLGPFRHDVKGVEGAWLDSDEFSQAWNRLSPKLAMGESFNVDNPVESLVADVWHRLNQLGRPLDVDMRLTLMEALAKDRGYTGIRRGDVVTSFYDVIPTAVRPTRSGTLDALARSTPTYEYAEAPSIAGDVEARTARRFNVTEREGEPWILITAENPQGKTLSEAENQARTYRLRERLDESGRRYVETTGGYIDGRTGERIMGEKGFIVFDVEPVEDGLVEGMRYGQNYMLTSDGMIDVQARTIQPSKGVRLNAEDAEYFSDVHFPEPDGGDVRIAMDLEDEARPIFHERLGRPGSGVEKQEIDWILGSGYDSAVQEEATRLGAEPNPLPVEERFEKAEEIVRERFRTWFGQSQADRIYHHASTADFDVIDQAYSKDIGFHIGTRGQAEHLAGGGPQGSFTRSNMMDIVPRVERPYRMQDLGGWSRGDVINELTQVDRINARPHQGLERSGEGAFGIVDDPYDLGHKYPWGYVDAEEMSDDAKAFLRSRGITPTDAMGGGGQPLNDGGFYDAEDLLALRKELNEEFLDFYRDYLPESTEYPRRGREEQATNAFIRQTLRDAGFDSIVYRNSYEMPTAMREAGVEPDVTKFRNPDGVWGEDGEFYEWEDSFILFDPNQAKDPSGRFGLDSDNIHYGIMGAAAANEMLRQDDEDAQRLGLDPLTAGLLFAGTPRRVRRQIVDNLLASQPHIWNPSRTARGVFDRSLLTGQPLGPQWDFARPIRGGSVQGEAERLLARVPEQDWERLRRLTERGMGLGGRTYYDPRALNEFLRQINSPLGHEMRDFWGPAMAATSPQSALPVNLGAASVLGYAERQGVSVDDALKEFRRRFPRARDQKIMPSTQSLFEGVRAGLPDVGISRAPKVASYAENLAGNLSPVTGDTHLANMATFFSPDKARKRFGGRSLDDAAYRPFEHAVQRQIAARMGIEPATAQAGLWFGGGPLSGLVSPWGDITQQVENSAYITARYLGIPPTPQNLADITEKVLRGEGFFAPSYKRGAQLVNEVGYPTLALPQIDLFKGIP